jgi:hypothetical protein
VRVLHQLRELRDRQRLILALTAGSTPHIDVLTCHQCGPLRLDKDVRTCNATRRSVIRTDWFCRNGGAAAEATCLGLPGGPASDRALEVGNSTDKGRRSSLVIRDAYFVGHPQPRTSMVVLGRGKGGST